MYIRKILLLLIVVITLGKGSMLAQQQDSLSLWFIENKDKIINSNESDKLFQNLEENYQKAVDLNQSRQESKALKALSYAHLKITKDLEKSLDYLIKASAIDEKNAYNKLLSLNNYLIALIFYSVDDFFNSEEFLINAIELNRQNKSEQLQILYKSQLGEVYTSTGQLIKAEEQYEDLLAYAKSIRYPELEAESLMNLGELSILNTNYQLALDDFLNALSIIRRIDAPVREARNLRKIGMVYQKLDQFDRSLANYKASIDILRSMADINIVELAKTFNQVGELYASYAQEERALANLNLALKYAQEAQRQELILTVYNNLSAVHKSLQHYKEALKYQELASALTDFLKNEKNDGNIIKMQNRYAINKQQEKIDLLEQNKIKREFELEEERRYKNFIQILLILSLVIIALVVVLLLNNRQKSKKLSVANEKVNQKNEALASANKTKDKFFSIIGHDLKGPLNSLTSFSNLLMNHTESLSTEEIKMLATDLDKSLKNLFALLENLLEWSRSQTGNIDFTPEEFSMNEMLEENRSLLKSQAENKNISIEISTQKEHIIKAHKKSIDTVVRNLLSNAIKFTHEGGKIKMLAKEKEHYLLVGIQDNGVGMPPAIRDKIFDLDSKHSSKGTAKEKGTGLGLVLCKEFVEKNGGSIEVKSEEDRGSLFYFRLPLK